MKQSTPRSMKSRFPEIEFKPTAKKGWDYRGIRSRAEYKPQIFTLKVTRDLKSGEYRAANYDDPFQSFKDVKTQAKKDGWHIVKMGIVKVDLTKEAA